MRKSILLLGALLSLSSYNQAQTIQGEIKSFKKPMVYLYQVKDEYYDSTILLDSIPVVNGKFTYKYQPATSDLYYLSLQERERDDNKGDYLFLSPVDMTVTIAPDSQGKVTVQATGSKIQQQYQAFRNEKHARGNREILDSLDALFYAAREKGNEVEMARVKEESLPYYDDARTKTQAFITESIKKENGTLFGLYLYFSYRFQHNTFNTAQEIADARSHIATFNEEAKASTFYTRIEEGLKRFEICATGSIAPNIAGIDMKGAPISLSQFKGKYVLVDFWSSSCGWCRKETVYFLYKTETTLVFVFPHRPDVKQRHMNLHSVFGADFDIFINTNFLFEFYFSNCHPIPPKVSVSLQTESNYHKYNDLTVSGLSWFIRKRMDFDPLFHDILLLLKVYSR